MAEPAARVALAVMTRCSSVSPRVPALASVDRRIVESGALSRPTAPVLLRQVAGPVTVAARGAPALNPAL
jgi:hypothetical protein